MSRMGAESCRFSSRMDGKRMENRKQIRKAKLPTGIDDFQKIRTNNYYYVDKTAVIWKMAAKLLYLPARVVSENH